MRSPAILFFLALTALTWTPDALARDQLRIVGSSTVYPFTTTVAEHFGQGGGFKTPIVESTGTGGGIKLFCSGIGDKTPDIVNASRPIKPAELQDCAKNGVDSVLEYKIGYDGVVFGHAGKHSAQNLTRRQLFLALAKKAPQGGKIIDNPFKTWKDVDAALPDTPILVYGPPTTSGTRDSLVELVMIKGCEALPEYKDMSDDQKKAACGTMREDGKYVEVGENDNLIIQRLATNPQAIGIFGYSFLAENSDKIKAVAIEGKAPAFESIADGGYPVSRSLFLYVKQPHIGKVPGVKEFLEAYFSDDAMGEYGYLADKGMISLPEKELAAQRQALKDGKPLTQ